MRNVCSRKILALFCCVSVSVFLSILVWAADIVAPEPLREFRGVWIATVHNIDWPSRPGLPVAAQQDELRKIFDRVRAIGFNAVLLQVRPACDAFYESSEPWSPYLTGKMGENPGYDPLAFAISEAHQNGLELHAWFNPYRALASGRVTPSKGHIKFKHPEWIRKWGSQLWLDPGAEGVDAYVTEIICDLARRYDVDGIHLDDYFYPYPPTNSGTVQNVQFDDATSWKTYLRSGGTLSRTDWRRENVNRLIRRIGSTIRSEKPWLLFGISPFGIWRPGVPEGIEANLDAFDQLCADARLWLDEGLVDYLAPQLYWNISPKKQSFSLLLDWWWSQSRKGRPVWPGIATDRIGKSRGAEEILQQITLAREAGTPSGHIHWGLGNLLADKDRIATRLAAEVYRSAALPPLLPWRSAPAPSKPTAEWAGNSLQWRGTEASRWLLQSRRGEKWSYTILPGTITSLEFSTKPDSVIIRGVGRDGRLSTPAIPN